MPRDWRAVNCTTPWDAIGLSVVLVARFVVTLVTTSHSGIEAAGSYRVTRSNGFPFVIEGMNKATSAGETVVIGFEANGGVLTQSDFAVANGTPTALPTRDSFLPILATLFLAKQQDKPLSAIAA